MIGAGSPSLQTMLAEVKIRGSELFMNSIWSDFRLGVGPTPRGLKSPSVGCPAGRATLDGETRRRG